MRVLVLHVGYSVRASYYDDWLDAFETHPGLKAQTLNLFDKGDRRAVPARLREADLAVILHSGTADTFDYVELVSAALKDRRCPLVVFMGNEFNKPWLTFEMRRAWLRSVSADIIASQLIEETARWLYEGAGGRVISVPHALNPAVFAPRVPRGDRRIDIGCRSFPYPVYLGIDTRNAVLRAVQESPAARAFALDISHEERFDRAGWAGFLNDCRFTVATEAGSAFLERDDARTLAIRDFLRSRRKGVVIAPDNPIRWLVRKLPWGIRSWLYGAAGRMKVAHEGLAEDPALHAEVLERFFAHAEPPPHHGGCISSRHFDAMGCGTVQLLVEGRYNDILVPGRHYIPIRPDFANLDAVLGAAADPAFGAEIAEEAAEFARAQHTHRHRIDALLARLNET